MKQPPCSLDILVRNVLAHVRSRSERTFIIGIALGVAFLQQSALIAQSVTLLATVPAGGNGEAGGYSLGWTVGQPSSSTYLFAPDVITAGVQQPEGVLLALNIKVLLDGPYRAGEGLMHDGLRYNGLLPWAEPYTALGYSSVGLSGGESYPSGVLNTEGQDAIVDWIFLEVRDAMDASRVVATRSVLVQRDGDLVDMDGTSSVRITALPAEYHVAIRHRNHLPFMTASPVPLGLGLNNFDLSDGSVDGHVPEALRSRAGVQLLWAGDVNADGSVKYTGLENDRDLILQDVGGVVPTATQSGYRSTDVNLDGETKYTGSDNDRDPVLQTIGGVVPTATRTIQLP